VVRYRRLSHRNPALQILGSQFCADCPDAAGIPAACGAWCDPEADHFAACRLTALCPCAREDSEARKRAFAAWLMGRLEAIRLRELSLGRGSLPAGEKQGDLPPPDGHTATTWRALAQLLLDAISPEEQHDALTRWAAAVLADRDAKEQDRLAALLRARQEAAGSPALNDRQRWALRRARACDQVDSMDIARQFGVSREMGRQDLMLLVQLGLLVRQGVGKGTVYRAAEEGEGEMR